MIRFLGCVFLLLPFQVFTQISLELDLQKRQLDKHYLIEYQPNYIVKIIQHENGRSKFVNISDQGNRFEKTTDDQVFDLINEDTTLYNWKYRRRSYIPVSSIYGYPLVIGDFNHNGKTDFA